MATPEPPFADPVALAAIDALLAARWECAERLSRKPAAPAIELLRGHAAELACSPLVRDQLLSAALEAGAADLEAGRPPLSEGTAFFFRSPAACDAARFAIREQVFRHGSVPARVSDEAVAELERRGRIACGSDRELCARLRSEARLHQQLWDDPRLPAQTHTRLVMLCTVPKLAERAGALDPSRARAVRRWDSPRRRRARSLVVARQRPARRRDPSSAPVWPIVGWLTALGLALAGAAGLALIDS